jgi:Flp pilus assembly protein TadG
MIERREPTLSGRTEVDEPLNRVTAASPRLLTAASRPTSNNASSPLAPFAILLAVASLVLGGFFYWQLTQFQQAVQQASLLAAAENRVGELEKRLNSTGETSEQSLAALQDKLKTNSAEVAKLWDAQNQLKAKMTASLEENNTSVNKQLQAALRDVESKSKQSVADVQSELKVLQDLVQAQQSSSSKDDESRKELASKITDVSKRLKVMESDLSERVRNTENAIESIDAFRLQVNREINKLKGGQ